MIVEDPCAIGFGSKFDLGKCAGNLLFGWVPDWLWMVLSWWPWILGIFAALVVIFVLAKIKELLGWPGVFAALTLGAYAVGRYHGATNYNPIENFREDDPDAAAAPQVKKGGTKRPTGIPVAKEKSLIERTTGRPE